MMVRSSRLALAGALVLGTTAFGAATSQAAGEELLPPNAKPGECYARLFVPPTYETETEKILKREASEKIEIIPAKYEWAEEKVLVQEESEKIEVVPAEFEWKEEKVLVKPASFKIEQAPAKYEEKEEKVLDTAAHTVWKKGSGPIQKVDNGTGEIMCLVEVPATYKTIKKRVLVEKAKTVKVEIPAEHQTIRKKVVKTPATTKKVKVPAAYKMVKVRKLVSAAEEKRTPIEAQYQTVTRKKKVGEGRLSWQAILCETNMTPGIVGQIQRALEKAGYNPGPLDGVIGTGTMVAMENFQKKNGLATGGITIETLKALGVTGA